MYPGNDQNIVHKNDFLQTVACFILLLIQYWHYNKAQILKYFERQIIREYRNNLASVWEMQTPVLLLTWPGSGGGIRVWGMGGTALPHVLQKRAYGSLGRSAKQNTHLTKWMVKRCLSTFFYYFWIYNSNILYLIVYIKGKHKVTL